MPAQPKSSSRPPSTQHVDIGLWIIGALLAVSGVVWVTVRLVALATGQPSTIGLADAGGLLVGWASQLVGQTPGPGPELVAGQRPGAALPAGDGVLQAVVVGLVLVLALAGLSTWALTRGRRSSRPGGRSQDAARWGVAKDLRPILARPGQTGGRLVLGTFDRGLGRQLLLAVEQLHSVFVLGPTQSRKTSGLAIPALLEWEGPAIVTSIKPDLLNATKLARWREGEVWIFDPAGFLGEDGASWDVLGGVTSWEKARELAKWLMEAAAEHKELGDATKGFFERRGQRPLSAALWAASIKGASIGQVRRWLDELDAEPPRPDRGEAEVARYNDAAEDILGILAQAGELDAMIALKSVLDETERQRSGSVTSAQDALEVFGNDSVERACSPRTLSGGQIDPDRLLDGGNTLYLYAPLHEQDRLRPVFEALIMSVVRTAMERTARSGRPLDFPLLVLLDEAGNVAPLRALAQIASSGAGQAIQLLTIFQDGAQLRHRYGLLAATVLNNHRAKVMLSGLTDPDSLELISRLIGDSAEVETSTTTGEERTSTTEHVAYRRLAPLALLRQTVPGEGVLVYGHLPPAKLRLRWWENDKDLARRAGPPQGRREVVGINPRGAVRDDSMVVHLGSRRRRRRAS